MLKKTRKLKRRTLPPDYLIGVSYLFKAMEKGQLKQLLVVADLPDASEAPGQPRLFEAFKFESRAWVDQALADLQLTIEEHPENWPFVGVNVSETER